MKMSKCFLLIIIIIVAVGLSLAGCQRSLKVPQTLTVTMSLGEEEWKVLREEIFPIFEERYNCKIRAYQIEAGQLVTKLEALEAGGKEKIDLFAQDNMNLAALANKDLVLDLSDYAGDIPAGVLPNLVEFCKFDGRLLFMPFRPNVQIVYYNEDAFKKYGLAPPRDWDQLLEVARGLKQAAGRGKLLLKGFGGNPTATQVYEFILQAGGRPYSFNDEGCILAFKFLQSLGPYLSPESKRAKWDTTNDILARGEAYLAQNWPFGARILIGKYGLESIKTYSGWRGPAGEFHVIGGDVFGIPKDSKNRELALKFIFFMQTKEIQEMLTSRLGWPSIRQDVSPGIEPWQAPFFASVKEALRHGAFRKNVLWWPVYEKYITEAFREIVFEARPVEETLNKYKAKLEEERKRY
jgi:trehalose transport system substrate-binding protein